MHGLRFGSNSCYLATVRDSSSRLAKDKNGDELVLDTRLHYNPDSHEVTIGPCSNPELNRYLSARSLLGRSYEEPTIQGLLSQHSTVLHNFGELKIGLIGDKLYSPPEVCSVTFSNLQNLMDEKLSPVVAVPASWKDCQRMAMKDAAAVAGLTIPRILNEPTAALLAYKFGDSDAKRYCVFHMGGSCFTVSIVDLDWGLYEIISNVERNICVGEDFDQAIYSYCVSRLTSLYGVEIPQDMSSRSRIMLACRAAKERLSSNAQADIEVSINGLDYTVKLTRARFEEINKEILSSIPSVIDEALREARTPASEIVEIVLSGGSTYIPKVRQLVSQAFGGKELMKAIPPEEVIAIGAAEQSYHMLSAPALPLMCMLSITPLSLGVASGSGLMHKIILRHTTTPVRKCAYFTSFFPQQSHAKIQIFEGERQFARDNLKMAEFTLEISQGQPIIQVTIDIDANDVIQVTASELASTHSQSVVIDQERNYTQSHLQRLLKERIGGSLATPSTPELEMFPDFIDTSCDLWKAIRLLLISNKEVGSVWRSLPPELISLIGMKLAALNFFHYGWILPLSELPDGAPDSVVASVKHTLSSGELPPLSCDVIAQLVKDAERFKELDEKEALVYGMVREDTNDGSDIAEVD